MSKAHTLGWPGAVLALVAFALWPALTVSGQTDPLDRVSKERAVAAQKLENEINQALVRVRELKTKNPKQALGILQTYKGIVENDDNLTNARRAQLVNYLSQRIQELGSGASPAPKTAPTTLPKSKAEAEYEKYLKGKSGSGSGSGAYDSAKKTFGSLKGEKNNFDKNKQEREKGFLVATGTRDLEAMPANGYMSYPKNWKKLMEIRDKFRGPSLTPQEAKLIKMMNSVMSPNYDKLPFRDVIKDIEQKTGMSIAIDPNALKDGSVEYDTPITFQAEKIQIRTILKTVLGSVNLAYIMKDGVVQVVTPQVARETMVVRTYPIRDLMPPSDPRMGPAYQMARTRYMAFEMMQMIVNTVEPSSWAINGGKGTIWFDPVTQSIVIRNSAELHLSAAAGIYR